jgi:hypothetical protein
MSDARLKLDRHGHVQDVTAIQPVRRRAFESDGLSTGSGP